MQRKWRRRVLFHRVAAESWVEERVEELNHKDFGISRALSAEFPFVSGAFGKGKVSLIC